MAGKGSLRRPPAISRAEEEARWNAVFGADCRCGHWTCRICRPAWSEPAQIDPPAVNK